MNNTKTISILKIISITVLGFILLPAPVSAQSVSLSLTPPILEAVVKPGKNVTQTYTLTNGTNETVVLLNIVPFGAFDEFGNVALGEDLEKYDPYETRFWFNVQSPKVALGGKFSLAPNASQDIKLAINVPEDAIEGDYYFTLIFQTEPGESLGVGQGSISKVKIGSNILLTVSKEGMVDLQSKIEEFSTPKLIDSFSPLPYTVRVANTGGCFFKPEGEIVITSWFGKRTLTLAPLNVIAKSVRQINCIESEKIVPCGLPKGFLLGPYKAILKYKIAGLDKTFESEVTTFAVPVYVIFTLGIILLAIGIFLKFRHKTRAKLPLDR